MRAKIGPVLLALFLLVAAQSAVMVNTSRVRPVFAGCPVGRDTGVTVVAKYQVGNQLSTAVIADSLQIGWPWTSYYKRPSWSLVLTFRGAYSGGDTLDRFAYVTSWSMLGTEITQTIRLTDVRPVDSTFTTSAAKVIRVQFRGRVATDSFGLRAFHADCVQPINDTTQWSFPFVGFAAEYIAPRQAGYVTTTGRVNASLPANSRPGMMVVPGAGYSSCGLTTGMADSGWTLGRVREWHTSAGPFPIDIIPVYTTAVSGVGGGVSPEEVSDTADQVRSEIRDTVLEVGGVTQEELSDTADQVRSEIRDTVLVVGGGGGGLDTTMQSWFFISAEFVSTQGSFFSDAPWYRSGFGSGGWTTINAAYDTNGVYEIGALHAQAQDSGDGCRVVLDHYFLTLGGNEYSRARWQVSYTDSERIWVGIHDMDGDGTPYGVFSPSNGVYFDIWGETLFCRAATAYAVTTAPTRFIIQDSVKYLSGVRMNASATRAYYEVWRWSDRVRVVFDSLSTGLPTGLTNGCGAVYYNYGKGLHPDFAQLFYIDFGVDR